jgi:hypothetical protein
MIGVVVAFAVTVFGFLYASNGDRWATERAAKKAWAGYGGPPTREDIEELRSQLHDRLGLERPEIREALDEMERDFAASQASRRPPRSPKRDL